MSDYYEMKLADLEDELVECQNSALVYYQTLKGDLHSVELSINHLKHPA